MIRFAGCGLFLLLSAALAAAQPPVPVPPAPGAVEPAPGPGPGGRPRSIRPVLTDPGPPRLDRHGDPLPAGAVCRYGTVRLRHGADVRTLSFSLDGKLLLTTAEDVDGLRLWDTATGKRVAGLDTTARLVALANAGFAVLVDDTKLKVWMYATGGTRDLPDKALPEGAAPTALAVNPDSKSCAVAADGKVFLIDLQTGKRLHELKVPAAPNNGNNPNQRLVNALGGGPGPNPDGPPLVPARLLYSPDGKWLAGSGERTGVWLWDARTGKRVRTYRTEIDLPEYAFSPDVTRLVVTGGGRLHLYALDSEEAVEGFAGPVDVALFAPRFSADGKTLSVVLQDGTVQPLDAETGEGREPLDPPDEDLRTPVALAPGAGLAAAVDQTGGIRIWDPKTGQGPEVPRLPPLSDIGFGPGGPTVLDEENKVHAFDPATGAPGKVLDLGLPADGLIGTWDPHTGRFALLAPAGDELEARFHDAGAEKPLGRYPLPPNTGLPHVSFAAGARDRAALFHQAGIAVVNPLTGKAVRTIDIPPSNNGNQARGALSPDGRLVAGNGPGGLAVWEVATGKTRFAFDAAVNCGELAFSPCGRFLAAADNAEAVFVYDVRTGAAVRKVQNVEAGAQVTALAVSAGGGRLAVGYTSGQVTVWDVGTGEVLAPFAGHDGMVTAAAFAPDGKRLATCAADGTAVVWAVPDRPAKGGPAGAAVAGFDEAFRLLGAADAAQAQRGLDYLYRRPAEAVKEAAARLAPPAPTPAATLARLVADLDSDDFPAREAAAAALQKAGGEAAPLLRDAAAKSTSAEVRKLANELLAKLDAPAAKPDDLRVVRAVEALEGLGTPDARALLAKWAAGTKGHRITAEAAAALERLGPGK